MWWQLRQVHPGGSLKARPCSWPAAARQRLRSSLTPGSRAQVSAPDTRDRCGTSARSPLPTPEATSVRRRAETRCRTPPFWTSTWSVSRLPAARREEVRRCQRISPAGVVSLPSRLSPEHNHYGLTRRGRTSCHPDLQQRGKPACADLCLVQGRSMPALCRQELPPGQTLQGCACREKPDPWHHRCRGIRGALLRGEEQTRIPGPRCHYTKSWKYVCAQKKPPFPHNYP